MKKHLEALLHMEQDYLTHGARNLKSHSFNPSFILCPDHIPVKATRYKISSPYG